MSGDLPPGLVLDPQHDDLSGDQVLQDLARGVVHDRPAEMRHGRVQVDLGAGQAGVPEHRLEDEQIGVAVVRVAGERVAETVGRDLGQAERAGRCDQLLEALLSGTRGEAIALLGEEERRSPIGAVEPRAKKKPPAEEVHEIGQQRERALAPSLAVDPDYTGFEVEVADVDGERLAEAQAQPVEQRQEEQIAEAEYGPSVDELEDALDLLQ